MITKAVLMPDTFAGMRSAAVIANVVCLCIAYGIRVFDGGALAAWSGTALYTCVVYGVIVFAWPTIRPLAAFAGATGFSWFMELSQLTPVPGYLSARSILARQVFGVQFDPNDLPWYPAGALLMMAAHTVYGRVRQTGSARTGSSDTATDPATPSPV